ncbi:hypothetical protein IAU60_005811 [Kwoniella sp. DSM 27419]
MPADATRPPHKSVRPSPYTRPQPVHGESLQAGTSIDQAGSLSLVAGLASQKSKKKKNNRRRTSTIGVNDGIMAEAESFASMDRPGLQSQGSPAMNGSTSPDSGLVEPKSVTVAQSTAAKDTIPPHLPSDREASEAAKKRRKDRKKERKLRKQSQASGGAQEGSGALPEPSIDPGAVVNHPDHSRINSQAVVYGAAVHQDGDPKTRTARDLAQIREEARRKEEAQRQLSAALDEAAKWKAEAEREKKTREDKEKEWEGLMSGLERQVSERSERTTAQDLVIRGHEDTRSALKEALECGVCLSTVNDPYLLSCGHMGCKLCLVEWFRTPAAYQSEIPDPITRESDLSHRVKLCHVCRAAVIRRPARVWFLRAILEPLGLYEDIAAPLESGQMDPWDKIFPIERETYKIYDEEDGVWRCPTCGGEIMNGECSGCGNEFSDIEEDDEWGSESDVIGSVLGDGPIVMDRDLSARRESNASDSEGSDDSEDLTGQTVVPRQVGNGDVGTLEARARTNPELASIFNVLNMVQGDDADRHRSRNRRRGRGGFIDSEAESDGMDGESVGYEHMSDRGDELGSESDRGPPGSEDEYGGSFIDDDGDQEEDEESTEDEEMYSEAESDGRSARRPRGGPPPRVRRLQSDEDDDSGLEVVDAPATTTSKPTRSARANRVVLSNSESE